MNGSLPAHPPQGIETVNSANASLAVEILGGIEVAISCLIEASLRPENTAYAQHFLENAERAYDIAADLDAASPIP